MQTNLRSDAFLCDAMERCGDAVYRLALCRLDSRADAEDVYQEVFLRLLRDTTAFCDDEHLKAWLLRVTVNCCNDLRRSAWFRHTAPLEAAPDAAAPVHDGHDELWQACARCQMTCVVVWLHYVEGYGTDELRRWWAAARRPCAPAHRARKKLRLELEGTDDEQPERLEPTEGYKSPR